MRAARHVVVASVAVALVGCPAVARSPHVVAHAISTLRPGAVISPAELRELVARNERLSERSTARHSRYGQRVAMRSAAAVPRASGSAPSGGYGPADIEEMYGVATAAPANVSVGVVDFGQDPTIEADLAMFRSTFGLPPCTSASGCFTEIEQNGSVPPATKAQIGETTLDVEAVSAICPTCHITLMDTLDDTNTNVFPAVQQLAQSGVHFISMSFSFGEAPFVVGENKYFQTPGTIYAAASGDNGYDDGSSRCGGTPVCYPASAPNVVAVGGLRVTQDATSYYVSAWSGSGSGCARYSSEPAEQAAAIGTPCGSGRPVADVAALADPQTGLAVYSTASGWRVYGGTSLATPLVAAMYAMSGNNTDPYIEYANTAAHPELALDVTTGTTVGCHVASVTCVSGPGWDGPTGVGMPRSPQLFATTYTPPPLPSLTLYSTSGSPPAVVALRGYPVTGRLAAAAGATSGLTWTANGLPPGVLLNPATGAVTGTPSTVGDSTVTLTATNSASTQATLSIDFQVVDAYTCNARLTARVGRRVSDDCAEYWSVAPNQGGSWVALPGQLSYSARGLPAGLSISRRTGLVSGVPRSAGRGVATLTVAVRPDGVLLTARTRLAATIRYVVRP